MSLTEHLKSVLQQLSSHPYPDIPNPATLKKRASVAVILRINPNYSQWPPASEPFISQSSDVGASLETFFAQDWVKHGDPEVLFMKRAAREGDRWTSHVALPGGRRDAEDQDDKAAAIRETQEEVGITLDEQSCLEVGNLPQRLVTTSWGKVPLMVLCPYLFLLIKHDTPPLRLQPTETASTHWVPLRVLLASRQRTFELQDVSSRLAHQEFGIRRWFLRAMLGQMVFAAVRLVPSESQYCTSIGEYFPDDTRQSSAKPPPVPSPFPSFVTSWKQPRAQSSYPQVKPLLLWGLTLGVMADFLELLPPHNALKLWTYPTFTPWDVRFAIWALSYRFRQDKKIELAALSSPDMMWGDEQNEVEREVFYRAESGFGANPHWKQGRTEEQTAAEVGISGIPSGQSPSRRNQRRNTGAVSLMLEGYYDIVRRAVAVALVGRLAGVAAIVALFWMKRKSRLARWL
jgi:8-oxo-dGTP pyrophosphatase MutT (NUDIX family)